MNSRTQAFAFVILAYLSAIWAAIGLAGFWPDYPQWLVVFMADIVATVIIFAYSVYFRNASFYDPYWSVIPMLIVLYLWLFPAGEINSLRSIMAGGCVLWWGGRLTYNWARGWEGLKHEDWRYGMLKGKSGKWYPLVNFLGIHLFPTLMVFWAMLPIFPALSSSSRGFQWLDGVALLVCLGAITVETLADRQLFHFRQTNQDPQAILESGLWKYSRHPNYLGEIGFWAGIALFGLAAAPEEWWRAGGAVGMLLMFLTISIPMIDRRMLAKRPAYARRMQKTSRLIPWMPDD